MLDILYLAKNRLEFTRASFQTLILNTQWRYVRYLWIYDDHSTDGTREYLDRERWMVPSETRMVKSSSIEPFGGPAAIMLDYTAREEATKVFAKIDNDVIVPPNWLERCQTVMSNYFGLDLLGIEPPYSRTPHYTGGKPSQTPETLVKLEQGISSYAGCDSIGGIGLMRTEAFRKYPDLKQHSIYGGFTDWQLQHADLHKGWICPPLDIFLLDRLPVDPWKTLSARYSAHGWQREWSDYTLEKPFWSWWTDQFRKSVA